MSHKCIVMQKPKNSLALLDELFCVKEYIAFIGSCYYILDFCIIPISFLFTLIFSSNVYFCEIFNLINLYLVCFFFLLILIYYLINTDIELICRKLASYRFAFKFYFYINIILLNQSLSFIKLIINFS